MDPISDMLSRIRNANERRKKSVELPHSKLKNEIASLMAKNGYLLSVKTKELGGVKKNLILELKYEGTTPAITGIKRISKPGQRIYSNSDNFQRFGGKRGMIVISTSEGILPHLKARKNKLGGEVVCVVY